jgi:hypothetical protein
MILTVCVYCVQVKRKEPLELAEVGEMKRPKTPPEDDDEGELFINDPLLWGFVTDRLCVSYVGSPSLSSPQTRTMTRV